MTRECKRGSPVTEFCGSEEEKLKKKSNRIFVGVLAAVVLAAAGFAGWLIWDANADPEVELCDYRNLKVNYNAELPATGTVAVPGGFGTAVSSDEKLSQAVLQSLVENSKYKHLKKTVDTRFDRFLAYYSQIAKLYDYSTVEELAVKYYGYESYEAFEKELREYSEAAVKQEMALKSVAEKEGLSVTDEVFDRYIKKYLAAYDYGENETDAFLENYGRADVYSVILNDYTLDKLIEWNGLRS